jgi:hypothetical protein
MFNRLIFAFTLIVSFGMAQIGAVTHEISHYSDITKASKQASAAKNISKKPGQSEPISHNQGCEKCISYAELGHLVQSTQAALVAVNATNHYFSICSQTPSYAQPRTYSARAPPSLV